MRTPLAFLRVQRLAPLLLLVLLGAGCTVGTTTPQASGVDSSPINFANERRPTPPSDRGAPAPQPTPSPEIEPQPKDVERPSTSTGSPCTTHACFTTAFAACTPNVTFTEDLGFASYHYEIVGPRTGGCAMETYYPTNPNPHWVNKKMTCAYDNTKDVQAATQKVMNALTTCTGPLADTIRAMNGASAEAPVPPPPPESPAPAARTAADATSATVTFVNAITGRAIPGHLVDCWGGCADFPRATGMETGLDGSISINVRASETANVSAKRTDWYRYDTVGNIRAGDSIVVRMNPQNVAADWRIGFPETTWTKNAGGDARLRITVLNEAGAPFAGVVVDVTGPIVQRVRQTAGEKTDASGTATIALPVHGAYRLRLLPNTTDFFQFEAPTGYTTTLLLDLSKQDALFANTSALSKDYRERGMMLVCARDAKTQEPLFFTIVIPGSTTSYSNTKSRSEGICIAVPRSYETIGINWTETHRGRDVSTANRDANDVLYVDLERR